MLQTTLMKPPQVQRGKRGHNNKLRGSAGKGKRGSNNYGNNKKNEGSKLVVKRQPHPSCLGHLMIGLDTMFLKLVIE